MPNSNLKFKTSDVADMFGVDSRTVSLWRHSGKLKPFEYDGICYIFSSEDIVNFLVYNSVQYKYFKETPPLNKNVERIKNAIIREVANRIESSKPPLITSQISILLMIDRSNYTHMIIQGRIKATMKRHQYYVEQRDFADFLIQHPRMFLRFKNAFEHYNDIVYEALHRSIMEEVYALRDKTLGDPLSLYELEDVFNVSVNAFYRYIRNGELRSISDPESSYYVYERDLVDFIHSNKRYLSYILNAKPRSKSSNQLKDTILNMYVERHGDYGKCMVYDGKCWHYSRN